MPRRDLAAHHQLRSRKFCICRYCRRGVTRIAAAARCSAPRPSLPSSPVADQPAEGPASKYTRLGLRRQPRDYLKRGHAWPDGRLVRGAPKEAILVQELAKRLDNAIDGRNLEEIEQLSGVNKTSINRLQRGQSWGTLPVIARLETTLSTDLWGNEHRKPKRPPRQTPHPDTPTGTAATTAPT